MSMLPGPTPPAPTPPSPPAPQNPPAPAPAAPAPQPTPPAAPDLGALQAAIDQAKNAGSSEAQNTLLKALGFDKLEDAQTFVKTARDAHTAQLSEVERREQAAATALAAAQSAEAEAKKLIERGVVRNALQAAGVSPENLDDAEGNVHVTSDITAETAKAAVEAMKAKPVFSSFFAGQAAPPPPTPFGAAPSGVTAPQPPPGGQPPASLLQQGAEIARQRYPQPANANAS
jgi:hypothetical protein